MCFKFQHGILTELKKQILRNYKDESTRVVVDGAPKTRNKKNIAT